MSASAPDSLTVTATPREQEAFAGVTSAKQTSCCALAVSNSLLQVAVIFDAYTLFIKLNEVPDFFRTSFIEHKSS